MKRSSTTGRRTGPSRAAGALAVGVMAVGVMAAGIWVTGCGDETPADGTQVPPEPAVSTTEPGPAATDAPGDTTPVAHFVALMEDETGFGPVNHTGVPEQKQWIAEAMGGGVIALDFDADGDLDLLVVDGNRVGGDPVPEARTRLFRNDGGFVFVDVTDAAGIDITGVGYGGAAADYDGDGDVDVWIGNLGRNHLLRNEGDGTFTDVAEEAGVAGSDHGMSTACAWGDVDGDGRLDLYVSNYIDMLKTIADFAAEGRGGRDCKWRGYDVYCGPQQLPFQKDRLYLQTKDGRFEDATDRLRDQEERPAFQALMVDVEGDGDLDIYVANDTEPNTLWVNDGTGTFRDDGMIAGCAYDGAVNPQAGMGADAGDYDGDGNIDLVVTNFSHDHYTLYRNRSEPRKDGSRMPVFEDVSVQTGVSQGTYWFLGWAALFLDVENDGDLDLFFSNGHVYGAIDNFSESGTTFRQRNLVLLSTGGADPRFVDATAGSGPGLAVEKVHRGGVMADLDNDGDADLVVTALNDSAYILRNDGGNANGWIRFTLEGRRPRDPAGATVRVEAAGLRPQTRVVLRGHSFLGGSDPRLLVGLGAADRATRVVVRWPSGLEQEFTGLAGRTHWRLVEGGEATKVE